jgi:hypothetical protein
MTNTIDFPTRGAPPPVHHVSSASTIMDMENPLIDLDRLIGGIIALAEGSDDDSIDLEACYALALRACRERDKLQRIWEKSIESAGGLS